MLDGLYWMLLYHGHTLALQWFLRTEPTQPVNREDRFCPPPEHYEARQWLADQRNLWGKEQCVAWLATIREVSDSVLEPWLCRDLKHLVERYC